MELKDLLLAPFYLVLVYVVAYRLRKGNTDRVTRKYFLPALTVKLIGAVALGLIYQFYYGGGDTYNFFRDSQLIWQGFLENPLAGVKMLLSAGQTFDEDTYPYTSRMWFYNDPATYAIIRLSAFFGLFTFHTYALIAILFACLSFSGVWALYRAFYDLYPRLHRELAISIFFLPSVFFWGSGLMKDSVCLGALGWLFHGFYFGAIRKEHVFKCIFIVFVSTATLATVKIYILLAFLPPALFWVFNENQARIKNKALRLLAKPVFFALGVLAAYLGGTRLTRGDSQYALDKIGERAKINAEYLHAVSISQNGSAYYIGALDGSIGSMLASAPQAINVALFRPYLWEVKNAVMLLSSIESTLFILLTIYLILRIGIIRSIFLVTTQPLIIFCLVFSVTLALAVGVTSNNFGTLVRYKIPLMPFYLSALYIMRFYVDKRRYQMRKGTVEHAI